MDKQLDKLVAILAIFALLLAPSAMAQGPILAGILDPQSTPATPTFTHIQSCPGVFVGSSDQGSITITCGSPIGAGHLLWLNFHVVNSNFLTISPATFTGDSGTFVQDWSFPNNSSISRYAWHVLSAGGGGTTITMTASSFPSEWWDFPMLTLDEWSSSAPITLDQSDVGHTGSSSTTCTTNSVTTVANGELIAALIGANAGGNTITPGTGYTAGSTHGTGDSQMQIYKTQMTAGSVNATATFGSADVCASHIVSFE